MKDIKAHIDSLSPISAITWDRVKMLFNPRALLKGEYFIQEGQTATQIAFLQEGLVRAFFRTAEGGEYNKHFFTFPCFFGGYSSLITGLPNKINQQAISDCKIFTANYAEFISLYPQHPDLETAARKLAELYFVNKEDREIEIVVLNADKRYTLFQQEFPGLDQKIPQYHIASYLGITPTQLSRIRRKFSGK